MTLTWRTYCEGYSCYRGSSVPGKAKRGRRVFFQREPHGFEPRPGFGAEPNARNLTILVAFDPRGKRRQIDLVEHEHLRDSLRPDLHQHLIHCGDLRVAVGTARVDDVQQQVR